MPISKVPKSLKLIDKYLERNNKKSVVVAVIFCCLILFLRRPDSFLHAQFWAEGGGEWFASAYNLTWWKPFIAPYAGTFGLAMRLIAFISTTLPLNIVPLAFNIFAMLVQVSPVFLLTSGRLKKIIPSRIVGIAMSIVYVSLPNSAEVFLNIANIQWHLGVAGFLVLLSDKSDKLVWKVFDIAVLVLVGLSGPLGLMLFPIILYLYYKERSPRNRLNFLIILVSSLIQAFSLEVLSHGNRLNSQPSASVLKFIKFVTGQIFTGGLAGSHNVTILYSSTILLILVFAFGLSFCAYAIYTGPRWLRVANVYGLLIVIFSIISWQPAKGMDLWGTFTHPGAGQRYWYIPIIVWISTIVWSLFNSRLKVIRYISALLILVMILVGIPGDWSLPKYKNLHYASYINKFEHLPKGTKFTIPINPPPWNMTLVKR